MSNDQRIEGSLLLELANHLIGKLIGEVSTSRVSTLSHYRSCPHAGSREVMRLPRKVSGCRAQLAEGILDKGWRGRLAQVSGSSAALSAAAALRDRRPDFLATCGLKDMLMTPLTLAQSEQLLRVNRSITVGGPSADRASLRVGHFTWSDDRCP